MTPLAEQVAAALQEVRLQIKHGPQCAAQKVIWECICDYERRVDQAIAEAVARLVKLYAGVIDGEWGHGKGPGSHDYESAATEAVAALRVPREPT